METLVRKPSDYYKLEKLDPAYSVYFGKKDFITIENSLEKIYSAFEKKKKAAQKNLKKFIKVAKKNYDIAIKDLVYKPGVSP